jgi:hypothetical protein
MPPTSRTGRFQLTPIADTRDRFRDFAPYVASINRHGTVAFQATLRDGGTGVFTATVEGGPCVAVPQLDGEGTEDYCSHPDIDAAGRVSVYTTRKSGGQRVLRIGDGRSSTIADTDGSFARLGPLGPTMNDAGTVAFRADTALGPGIFAGDGGPPVTIATSADARRFRAFHGLPVINRTGAVVFRADTHDGVQGIYIYTSDCDRLETLVDTSRTFRTIGWFPCVDDAGAVTFSATCDGHAGIFKVKAGHIETIVDTRGPFESVRGSLINESGTVIFYATPHGGALGIYAGPDPTTDKVVTIGDPAFGSTVVDFALNPVSLNEAGQVALRLALADGTQLIVRAEAVE